MKGNAKISCNSNCCNYFSRQFFLFFSNSLGYKLKYSIFIVWSEPPDQGPTSTRYSNRTRIFLYYSNPTRKFLKNDRVASSMYTTHFRKIAVRLTIFCCPWYKTFPFWQKFDQRSSWKSCHLIFLSSASSKTQIYFQHVNVFKMLLTIIMTMVMMTIISAMIIITKYSLPTIDFATRYSTRYSDFLLQPYSNPTRSQKSLLVGACC